MTKEDEEVQKFLRTLPKETLIALQKAWREFYSRKE